MRCEHVVERIHLHVGGRRLHIGKGRFRTCRCRLKTVSEKVVIEDLAWHVYRCRRGHETRYYVEP